MMDSFLDDFFRIKEKEELIDSLKCLLEKENECFLEEELVDLLEHLLEKENGCNKTCSCFLKEEVRKYDPRDFISLIFNIGREDYVFSEKYEDPYSFFKSVRDELDDISPYVIVRKQEECIAIAIPSYIRNAPEVIGKKLGIVPEIFVEVYGPQSTVLIIDCEKQWLKSKYLGIGEEEWLL